MVWKFRKYLSDVADGVVVKKKSLICYKLPEEYAVTEYLLVFKSLGSLLVLTEVILACSENF